MQLLNTTVVSLSCLQMKPRGTVRSSTFKPQDERKRKRQQRDHHGSAYYMWPRGQELNRGWIVIHNRAHRPETQAYSFRNSLHSHICHLVPPADAAFSRKRKQRDASSWAELFFGCAGRRAPQNRMLLPLISGHTLLTPLKSSLLTLSD